MIEIVPSLGRWPKATLGDLCEIRGGFPAPQDEAAFEDGEIPFVRMKDVGRHHFTNNLCETEQSLNRSHFRDGRYQLTPRGSILMPRSGSVALNHRAVLTVEAVVVSHLCALVPISDKVTTDFLYRFLCLADMRKLTKKTTGLDSIAFSDLRLVAIPLPPLVEQRRIAEVLDKAEALRAKRRAALAQLDSLTQSLFLDLFGDPIANERQWPIKMVKDFVAGFESGKSIVADDEDDTTSACRVLKVSAVTSLEFRPEQSKPLPPNYEPPVSHRVKAGDLLFSRANTAELIGATAFVHSTPANLFMPDKIWRFVWHNEPKADPHFVRFLFQQPKFRMEISQRASGTSGSMKNISQDKVLTIKTGLPPLDLQREFARRVAAVEKLKTAQRTALAELDALFASLQHRAFRGEL